MYRKRGIVYPNQRFLHSKRCILQTSKQKMSISDARHILLESEVEKHTVRPQEIVVTM